MSDRDKVNVPVASPDFDDLRDSLKEYLKTHSELTDYDFEGSVLSTLVDTLAYNSHVNAYYLNMVANESFLSTAIRRESVVERASQLGYVPTSARSATAHVWVELFPTNSSATTLRIPRGTQFTANDKTNDFTFSTTEDVIVNVSGDGKFIVSDLPISEGRYLTHKFTVTEENGGRLVIPNPDVDTSTMRVRVKRTGETIQETYLNEDDISNIDSDSNVYFLREDFGGRYAIEFGDGVLSRDVPTNSEVTVDYIVSNKEAANGIGKFSLESSISGVDSYDIQIISSAVGGKSPESISSIKHNAPIQWGTQSRAVTAKDYESIVRKKYSNVRDVIAWGGEDNDPPRYGAVFIAVRPLNNYFLTDAEKEQIKTILSGDNIVSIQPIIEDADFTQVNVDVEVFYNTEETGKSAPEIETEVSKAIDNFSENVIGQFDRTMRYSVLSRTIDSAERAIVANNLSISLEKRIFPELNVARGYDVQFNAALKEGSIISSTFEYTGAKNCFFAETDNVPGKISIFKEVGSDSRELVTKNVGDVNYDTGKIDIQDVEIDAITQISSNFDGEAQQYFVGVRAETTGQDITPKNQQIIEIGKKTIAATPIKR